MNYWGARRKGPGSILNRYTGIFLTVCSPSRWTNWKGSSALHSANSGLYRNCLQSIGEIESVLKNTEFRQIVSEDPRHLFLLASSRKYPHIFFGYKGNKTEVPVEWQQAACSILKMGHLIKSIEEDSQDIDDYAQLGFFLEMQGQSLDDLYYYDWENPGHSP